MYYLFIQEHSKQFSPSDYNHLSREHFFAQGNELRKSNFNIPEPKGEMMVLYSNQKNLQLRQLNQFKELSIFRIKMEQDQSLEIYLNYNQHRWTIGFPERADHLLYKLPLYQAIRYQINGKRDATLTRGKERSYHEHDISLYFTDHLDFDQITPQKNIDERKILY